MSYFTLTNTYDESTDNDTATTPSPYIPLAPTQYCYINIDIFNAGKIYAHKHTYTHKHIQTCIYTQAQTYTDTNTQTNTQMQTPKKI